MNAVDELVNGLSVGSVYALLAVGYTLVYGVLRLINFAHGEFFMIGAVVGYFTADHLPTESLPPWLAVATGVGVPVMAGGLAGAVTAAICQAWVYRPIRGEGRWAAAAALGVAATWVTTSQSLSFAVGWPATVTIGLVAIIVVLGFGPTWLDRNPSPPPSDPVIPLLAALGVSLAIQHGTAAVISPDPRPWPILRVHYEPIKVVTTATDEVYTGKPGGGKVLVCAGGEPVPAGPWPHGLFIDGRPNAAVCRGLIVGCLALSAVGVFVLIRFSRTGKAMRALAWDAEMARLLGVRMRPDTVYTVAFLVGGFLAGATGVLWGLRYGRIDPFIGQLPGLKAFVAAAIGGRGSVPGAVVAGLLLGLVETSAAAVGFSGQRDAVAFVALILMMLVRPHGLFGRPEGEKV